MTTFTVTVELFVNGAWLDITHIDDDTKVLGAVTITRGRSDQQSEVAPTSVTFDYLDNNATLDGENPLSAYYHEIAIGTLMRVSVGGTVRAYVEIVKWEATWQRNANGDDVTVVDVEGAGILRRIDAEAKPLQSPAYRAITAVENDADRVAYWPCEEESGATSIFSPDGVGAASSFADTINFGAYTDGLSTPRMLVFGDSTGLLFFTVPSYASTEHKVGSLWTFPETSLAADTVLLRLYCTGGNIDFIDLVYRDVLDGDLSLKFYRSGVLLDQTNLADFSSYIVAQHAFITIELTQNGSDLDTRLTVVNMNTSISGVETTDTTTGVNPGRISFITAAQTDCAEAAFGQLMVGSSADAFANYIDMNLTSGAYGIRGYINESIDRINRIADEEDIPVTISGSVDTGRLATQGIQTAMEIIRDAVNANRGILYELRDDLSLGVRTRLDLYDQIPVAELSYGHLLPGFKPVTDDRITNKVTAQRDGGSTAVYTIPDGDFHHWTTEDPPDGARERTGEVTVAVSEDGQLPFFAAWEAHLRSWREKRFPLVPIELARTAVSAGNITNVLALDIGDIFTIDTSSSSPYIPSNELRLMVQGYTEVIGKLSHYITFNCTPADPYEAEVVDAASVIANVINSTDTSVKLAITDDGPAWSTTDEPYYIQVNGDAMTVTTITTDTPAFIAAGTPAYADNASVVPSLPAGMTAGAGQLMLLFAACRQTGSGVIGTTITGWTLIISDGNICVFGRYYVSGDAAPTVTTSGGAAGSTVGAVICAFSGLSMNLDKNNYTGSYPNGWVNSVNGSAQNILYPAYLNRRTNSAMMLWGHKDDDWTSVGTIGGTAELVDSSSLTGNDMGIVWDFYNPGTPTTVISQSFTVTGGASAVSEGIVAGFRPLQTATVTRNINGVATSHSPGETVRAWRLGVNGL